MDVQEFQSGTSQTGQSIKSYVGEVLDESPITSSTAAFLASSRRAIFLTSQIWDFWHPGADDAGDRLHDQAASRDGGKCDFFGLAIGCAGQGEFTDRFGRKAVYQFNLLLFGLTTVASAFAPNYEYLRCCAFSLA